MKYIVWFNKMSGCSNKEVGGKNSGLGAMITQLSSRGITVPHGFAVTTKACNAYYDYNHLAEKVSSYRDKLVSAITSKASLGPLSHTLRSLLEEGILPPDVEYELALAYDKLSDSYNVPECYVAVRSSATAEDMPDASFAGQHDTFLYVLGKTALFQAYKRCLSSLFTERALIYRQDHGIDLLSVDMSVGVQKMVRADHAASGVAFSLDPDTGFRDVIIINSSYGLGEAIVKGDVTPDEFVIHKALRKKGYASVIVKQCGTKQLRYQYKEGKVGIYPVPKAEQQLFSLSDSELLVLADMMLILEEYAAQQQHVSAIDVEWAKDQDDGKLYIVQMRPETVHRKHQKQTIHTFTVVIPGHIKPVVEGQAIGNYAVGGKVCTLSSLQEGGNVQEGDIVVTHMTHPDWLPIMKKASALVTDEGGRTCHAAIVGRELGIPVLVGTGNATQLLRTGQIVTIDGSKGGRGYIYDGTYEIKHHSFAIDLLPQLPVNIMINTAYPERSFENALLPVTGVGLVRVEFIIGAMIKIHPMACSMFDQLRDEKVKQQIQLLSSSYTHPKAFFIDTLARGIGCIAASFYPRVVTVRFSDFKSNEYAQLIGGELFEEEEANPMMGFRGAVRYYSDTYAPAFQLECAAYKRAREVIGCDNIQLMIPFVRTVNELKKVRQCIEDQGITLGEHTTPLIMMLETPANILLIDQFAPFVDGFSIGSNDLTQFTLAVDRDAEVVASLYNESDDAVVFLCDYAIKGALRHKLPIGICGQAPSDDPEFARLLMQKGITSISLNADQLVSFLLYFANNNGSK
ncbi:MAG: phosphoenolpyruvate synthase [Candidatus Babeliales bacterium]